MSVFVPAEIIRVGFPHCAMPEDWAAAFTAAFARFPDFNALGVACILGKAQGETGGLTRWDENLNYSDPARILDVHGERAGRTWAGREAVRKHKKGEPWPEAALADAREIVGDKVALGDRVYSAMGGYAARGGGAIQLTGDRNQRLFAEAMGMTLAEARDYMRTIPGAAMTAPWYIQHFGAMDAANRGDMKEVMRVVAGKATMKKLDAIWKEIKGDAQVAAFTTFRGLLGA